MSRADPRRPTPLAADETLTYRERSRGRTGDSHPALYLVLETDVPLSPPARVLLSATDELEIGRGKARTLDAGRLSLPGHRLSRRHARLVREGPAWVVDDLGSKNGTLVDGVRVRERTLLRPAAVLELGGYLFTLREDRNPGATALEVGRDGPRGLATVLPDLAADFERVARAAKGARPLLILGETGTGKDLVAAEMHRISGRSGSYLAVNCAALTDGTLQAQLFGHERGAFTGAVAAAPGIFRAADQGTVLLDEISDLGPAGQAALLRVLQSGEVLPVGAARPVTVDPRVIAATNRPLAPLVDKGEFRADLYARLAGTTITLPPLRDRREDLGLLAAAIVAELGDRRAERVGLTRAACYALLRHPWRFNIRQLFHVLGGALEQASASILDAGDLPLDVDRVETVKRAPDHAEIVAALERHRGIVTAAARELEVSRAELYRMLARCGIDPWRYRR
jgi:DNA-binding NtrC family response regulator